MERYEIVALFTFTYFAIFLLWYWQLFWDCSPVVYIHENLHCIASWLVGEDCFPNCHEGKAEIDWASVPENERYFKEIVVWSFPYIITLICLAILFIHPILSWVSGYWLMFSVEWGLVWFARVPTDLLFIFPYDINNLWIQYLPRIIIPTASIIIFIWGLYRSYKYLRGLR